MSVDITIVSNREEPLKRLLQSLLAYADYFRCVYVVSNHDVLDLSELRTVYSCYGKPLTVCSGFGKGMLADRLRGFIYTLHNKYTLVLDDDVIVGPNMFKVLADRLDELDVNFSFLTMLPRLERRRAGEMRNRSDQLGVTSKEDAELYTGGCVINNAILRMAFVELCSEIPYYYAGVFGEDSAIGEALIRIEPRAYTCALDFHHIPQGVGSNWFNDWVPELFHAERHNRPIIAFPSRAVRLNIQELEVIREQLLGEFRLVHAALGA